MAASSEDNQSYEKLLSDEDIEPPRTNRRWSRSALLPWLLHSVLLTLSVSILLLSWKHDPGYHRCGCATEGIYSPAQESIEQSTQWFEGFIETESVYKGDPRPELEAAWDDLISFTIAPGPTISVSEQELDLVGKGSQRDVAARLPSRYGGGHLATIEIFHNLHCLNLIRKATYKEDYPELNQKFRQHRQRLHVDHCIDMIRQRLMCTADPGIVTWVWVDGYGEPYPDFSTQHQCNNFDQLYQWAHEHEVNVSMDELRTTRGPDSLTEPPQE